MRITYFCLGLLLLTACTSNQLSDVEMPLTIVPSPQITSAAPVATETKTSTPTPAYNLPNLRVISARNTLQPTNCLIEAPYENRHVILVQFTNDGIAIADSFILRINGKDAGNFQQMEPATTREYEVSLDGAGEIVVEIDPLNEVKESNEEDNIFNAPVMTLTPPARCTLTPSMTPT